jgi:1-deoxy-D-xylulose-5-phosphate reductoisomerase
VGGNIILNLRLLYVILLRYVFIEFPASGLMKKIVVLGSTGSIGRSALSVISAHSDKYKIVGLTANRNHELLLRQIKEFGPEIVAVSDPEAAAHLRAQVKIPVLEAEEGVCRVSAYEDADFVLSAIVGFAGLMPTLSAVKAGKTIGLANKETLVTAGSIVMEEARKSGSVILPVDSEHSAVFQCLKGADKDSVRRIILTASGGPFLNMSIDELENVRPEDALRHPNWSMGRKITVDSATLMNKGLEVIEAHHLFGLEPERIGVIIHPQSIVHSMVEFVDGCIIAQMSVPDMKAPIAYALSYPERLEGVIPCLDLSEVSGLTFSMPDTGRFPCLSYAYDALREKGVMPAVLNASNEAAVDAFLGGDIGFNDIPAIIKNVMDNHGNETAGAIGAVLEADGKARREAAKMIKEIKKKG